MKTKCTFFKLHGAGNDFIIIDNTSKKWNRLKKNIPKLCDRNLGIGADGVVFLEKPKSKKHTYRWDFYNNDGSRAEACMNASRCVVLFAVTLHKKKQPIIFETTSGLMIGRMRGREVELELIQNFKPPQQKIITVDNQKVIGFYIDTGVPHFVVIQEAWAPQNWKDLALKIQQHPEFAPRETNVTFMTFGAPETARAITFERGVKNYTLACGTGAVAAALTLLQQKGAKAAKIQMPGGDLRFYSKNKKNFLCGPAVVVYKGQIA
jgi:diaminopimelate epimerase